MNIKLGSMGSQRATTVAHRIATAALAAAVSLLGLTACTGGKEPSSGAMRWYTDQPVTVSHDSGPFIGQSSVDLSPDRTMGFRRLPNYEGIRTTNLQSNPYTDIVAREGPTYYSVPQSSKVRSQAPSTPDYTTSEDLTQEEVSPPPDNRGLAAAPPATPPATQPTTKPADLAMSSVEPLISTWHDDQKKAVRELVEKFGPPDETTKDLLIWKDKGDFRKIVVSKDSTPHNFPTPHHDFVAVEINCKVPLDKVADLQKFDGSLIVNRTSGTLAARCNSLGMDIAALNLANDIIDNKKSVEDARQFLGQVAQGQHRDYTQNLNMGVARGQPTGDPDQAQQGTAADQP